MGTKRSDRVIVANSLRWMIVAMADGLCLKDAEQGDITAMLWERLANAQLDWSDEDIADLLATHRILRPDYPFGPNSENK